MCNGFFSFHGEPSYAKRAGRTTLAVGSNVIVCVWSSITLTGNSRTDLPSSVACEKLTTSPTEIYSKESIALNVIADQPVIPLVFTINIIKILLRLTVVIFCKCRNLYRC